MRTRFRKQIPGLILLIVLVMMVLISLWHARLSFRDVTLSNQGGLSSRLSLTLFQTMITLAQFVHLVRTAQTPHLETPEITNRAWIAGFAATLIGIAGLIVYVDPNSLYGTHIYEPRVMAVRDDKLNGYDQLPETPDVVVLGSSRAFTVLPEFFEQDFGYTAFNMAVEGAWMDDYVLQTKYILEHDPDNPPEVLMIEIIPPLPSNADEVARRSPFKLIPYMDSELQKRAVQAKLEGLLDLQALNEAIYTLRYFATHDSLPADRWTFAPDGGGSHPPQQNLKAAVLAETKSLRPPRCPRAQLDPDGIRGLEQIVEMAAKHQVALIFYVTPRHPDYFDRVMADTPRFRQCQNAMRATMNDLTRRYPFVFFLDYSRLSDISGVANGYYDSQHMTPLNNHSLVQAAACTIQQAYATAEQQRASSEQISTVK